MVAPFLFLVADGRPTAGMKPASMTVRVCGITRPVIAVLLALVRVVVMG